MVAVIGDSDQAASIGLHEAAGFKHAGTFENIGYKFERWLDSVLMQRALGRERASRLDRSVRHERQTVDRSQHTIEFVAAPHDQTGRRNHAIGALAARQLRSFFDAVERHFRGAAEH